MRPRAVSAAGGLVVPRFLLSGALSDVLQLDDESAHKAAFPVTKDGKFELDEMKIADREKAMVARLLASDEPVSIIVLGAAHDLGTWIDGRRIQANRATDDSERLAACLRRLLNPLRFVDRRNSARL